MKITDEADFARAEALVTIGSNERRTHSSIPFWSPAEVEAAIRPGARADRARRVLAYPTETVYGFGGGIDHDSVDALVALKRRPPGKPFLLLDRRRAT